MNIVALGEAACNIAEKFKKYSIYKVYQIDNKDRKKSRYFLRLPFYQYPYEYEQSVPQDKIEKFFKGMKKEDTFFITCGSSSISLLSLVILQHLSKISHVSIIYIKPDTMFLNDERREQEKIIFQYLQQYTLHDFLQQMYVFNNLMVEKAIEDIDMDNYHDKINEIIVWSIHNINFYDNQKSIANNFFTNENYGIKTISISQYEKESEEKTFFLLDNVREKRYYYLIGKNALKNDKGLFNRVRESIKEKIESEKMKIFYGIYSTEMEENMILTVSQSMVVQK